MTTVLAFLGNLKLTLTQWLLLGLALLVAGLVAVLKVQGSELHSMQVQLLEAHVAATLQKPQADVDAARSRYKATLAQYHNAGGR